MGEKRRNLFEEVGYSSEEIDAKIQSVWNTFFYGSEEERIYHPAGEDMGYLVDTGNIDARTEGMSYGMMICVQLDKQDEFDRIWKWAKTYMFMDEGFNRDYFCWSNALDGTKNADGPAPDGEEFFAMSLFFASHRWGDREGIFNYSEQARQILSAMINKGKNGRIGTPMFNNDNHQILFVPGIGFTDPSYHLPHFYELFALWAYEEDRAFFAEAAKVSREYLKKACHEKTGLCAEYANFDGSPMSQKLPWSDDRHDLFYSDSYRTAANIGLDYEWFKKEDGPCCRIPQILEFFKDMEPEEYGIYEIDGTPVEGKALHPVGLFSTLAMATLAVDTETAKPWVKKFFEMPLRTGVRRYYDNCLYFFAVLALSGNYTIWR